MRIRSRSGSYRIEATGERRHAVRASALRTGDGVLPAMGRSLISSQNSTSFII
jgi:hypothetical protein